jgi:hexokinase
VGTLLTRGYLTGSCFLGAIFGTGTNGAYVEDMATITKLKNRDAKDHPKMIINTEWGAFDNAVRTGLLVWGHRAALIQTLQRYVLPITRWDNALDRISINP